MSLLFVDGFDHYDAIRQKWVVSNPADAPTFVAGRFGGQALKKQFQNAAGTISHDMGQQSEAFFGLAFQAPGLPTVESMFRFKDTGGTTRCSVQISSNGTISVVAGGFIASSSVGVITTGSTWHYIECRYIAKSSAGQGGIAQVRVDGVVVATIDGALFATTLGTSDDIRFFEFTDNGTNSPRYLYDDLYLLNGDGTSNNTYLGDVRVTTMYPLANGTTNDFTSSTGGAQWTDVDETLMNSDTDYVESGLIGASEDYNNQNFSDKGVGVGTIFGVQSVNGVKRTDAGSLSYKNEMVISGIRYTDGLEHVAQIGSYFIRTYIRDTDPSDSATWTESKVAAVGSGFSITDKEL